MVLTNYAFQQCKYAACCVPRFVSLLPERKSRLPLQPISPSSLGSFRCKKMGTMPFCLSSYLQGDSVQIRSHEKIMAEVKKKKKRNQRRGAKYHLKITSDNITVYKCAILRLQHSYFSCYLQVIKQKKRVICILLLLEETNSYAELRKRK